jgi:hypothetical protein
MTQGVKRAFGFMEMGSLGPAYADTEHAIAGGTLTSMVRLET